MTTKLMAPAVYAARTIGALAAALMLAVLLAQAAAADDQAIDAEIAAIDSVCQDNGGSLSVFYDFNADGTVGGVTTTCNGGSTNGEVCKISEAGWSNCTMPFTPEESPELPGGGTNKPDSPYDDPRTGDIIVTWTGTYSQDGGQTTTGQTTTGQYNGTYGTQVEVEEDTEPITPVQYRRIVRGEEYEP